MGTTPTGRNGLHVRQHVVSGSEHVIEHVPVPSPSSEGSHVKSRDLVCPMKPNTAICVNVEVCVICGLKTFEAYDVVLVVVELLRGSHIAPVCSYHPFKDPAFGLVSASFRSRASQPLLSSPCTTTPSTYSCLPTPSPSCSLKPRLPPCAVQFLSLRSEHSNPAFAHCFKSSLFNC